MANLDAALQQLRTEREQTQSQVQKLGQAISLIESLNGSQISYNGSQPKRFVSAVSRRKMAQAQRARREKELGRVESVGRSGSGVVPARRTMSGAARRKIAAAQKARWAKARAQQKKAA